MRHTREETLRVARELRDIGTEAIQKSLSKKKKDIAVQYRPILYTWDELPAHVKDGFIALARHVLERGYRP